MKTSYLVSLSVLLIIIIFKKTDAQAKRKNTIILTGDTGHGKSTSIRRIYNILKEENVSVVGFYVRKYRTRFKGTGLEVVNLDTLERAPFVMYTYYYTANRKLAQIGQYLIDPPAFERVVKPILSTVGGNEVKIALLDEMGRYECVSSYFVNEMQRLFKSSTALLVGTSTSTRMFFSLFGNFTTESDVFISPIRRQNRTETPNLIARKIISMYNEITNG